MTQNLLAGSKSTRLVVNACTSLTAGSNGIANAGSLVTSAKNTLCGAMTANVLKTVLSVSGSGVADVLALASIVVTAMTLRLRVVVDGAVAFDVTCNGNTNQVGLFAAGGMAGSAVVRSSPVHFAESLLVEVAQGATGTDQCRFGYSYQLVEG